MRIDLPSCDFRMCRRYFDGNCNASESGHESCEYRIIQQQQLTNGWIPVDSRLPDKDGLYIGSTYQGISMEFYFNVKTAHWYKRNDAYDVIAWQPLPEPYKEDKDAERN